ncbi:MAG: alanine-zipper protein [Oscillospiraceae bacterium]|nr:alanine-zipper protein [Oscillospiraceae bacterium]
MQIGWNNHMYLINGRVKSPIVLRSETELFIAQNAHNLIWERHWDECEALDHEIARLKKAGEDSGAVNEKLQAIFPVVKAEIDALILAEITAYRETKAGFVSVADICERLDSLERKVKDVREIAEEAQGTAEEAQSTAEDAQSAAEDAQSAADDASGAADELRGRISELEEALSDSD